jgi:hypothetical protein
MKIAIYVNIEDGDPNADPNDPTGVTNDAFEKLTGVTGEPPLGWLGEVEDIQKVSV